MSEALNAVFVENFQRDPTLTWQYFGSSTGFFRIYPGENMGGITKILLASSLTIRPQGYCGWTLALRPLANGGGPDIQRYLQPTF